MYRGMAGPVILPRKPQLYFITHGAAWSHELGHVLLFAIAPHSAPTQCRSQGC